MLGQTADCNLFIYRQDATQCRSTAVDDNAAQPDDVLCLNARASEAWGDEGVIRCLFACMYNNHSQYLEYVCLCSDRSSLPSFHSLLKLVIADDERY
ncbi:hypothetical protein NPIL_90051 [Nephila pilipes]|uniref:Uncharacterized protein n=1 Tax=Nephila pilipes TaxID=299642 RepID=A0A8X6N1A8_NEPPI|nr:hypothetical protein NPIL_90051 [Nephila pilipes]